MHKNTHTDIHPPQYPVRPRDVGNHQLVGAFRGPHTPQPLPPRSAPPPGRLPHPRFARPRQPPFRPSRLPPRSVICHRSRVLCCPLRLAPAVFLCLHRAYACCRRCGCVCRPCARDRSCGVPVIVPVGVTSGDAPAQNRLHPPFRNRRRPANTPRAPLCEFPARFVAAFQRRLAGNRITRLGPPPDAAGTTKPAHRAAARPTWTKSVGL